MVLNGHLYMVVSRRKKCSEMAFFAAIVKASVKTLGVFTDSFTIAAKKAISEHFFLRDTTMYQCQFKTM